MNDLNNMAPLKWFPTFFLFASVTIVTKFRHVETKVITKDADEDYEDTTETSESESDETLPTWSLTSSDEDFGSYEEWLTWSTFINVPAFNLTETTTLMLRKLVKFVNTDRPSPLSPLYDNSEEGILAIILKFEIFTKSAGRNFILPEVEDKNSTVNLRSIAYAITNLWLRLKSADAIERTLSLIIRRAVTAHTESGRRLTKEELEDLLRKVLRTFDLLMPRKHPEYLRTYNESLRMKFIRFPNNKAYIPFKVLHRGQVDGRRALKWLTDANTAAFLIHQQVLGAVTKKENDTETETLLRLILEVANTSYSFTNNCQTIYREALKRAAKRFKPDEFPRETMRSFVNDMDWELATDPDMQNVWPSKKRERLITYWHDIANKGGLSRSRKVKIFPRDSALLLM